MRGSPEDAVNQLHNRSLVLGFVLIKIDRASKVFGCTVDVGPRDQDFFEVFEVSL